MGFIDTVKSQAQTLDRAAHQAVGENAHAQGDEKPGEHCHRAQALDGRAGAGQL